MSDTLWAPTLLTTGRMTGPERTLFHVLWPDHVGMARAISREELCRRSGLSDRVMRDTVTALIVTHGVPIGSGQVTPPGYYIVATADEAATIYRAERSRGISCLARAHAIKRTCNTELIRREQMSLPLPADLRN